jgi:hypothetical protein
MEFIKHWLTERDNSTYCIARFVLASGAGAMIYNFLMHQSPDFQGFGTGLCAVGLAIAAKNISEKS